MQENVNAINITSSLIANFGSDNVSVEPNGQILLKVKEIGNGDLLSISNMLQWSNVYMKRSDKHILTIFTPRKD